MADRKSADDRSNIQKIYKPIASYFSNVKKEVGEYGSAYKKADKASLDVTAGANARARAANKNERAQRGQAFGAILKNARYDNKGNRR